VLTGDDGKVKAVITAGRDVTEERRLEADVIEISDREQQRIGQDLHDSLGQQLTAIGLMCHSLQKDPAFRNPALKHKADRVAGLLHEAIRQTRALSHGLAPLQPGAEGLMQALRELARITSESGMVKCTFHCAKPVPIADCTVAGHLYRIAQEAVTNATKHGSAREISIELTGARSTVRLRVSDNGKGLRGAQKRHRGMGLQVMNSRAEIMGGKVKIHSPPRKGVTVECTVPVGKP
jgi:signal transduction histidine kinase